MLVKQNKLNHGRLMKLVHQLHQQKPECQIIRSVAAATDVEVAAVAIGRHMQINCT